MAAGLALLLGGCGAERTFDNPPCPVKAPVADGYEVTLTTDPQHAHLAEVITFTFRVAREGAPVSDLSPKASYRHEATGGTGNIQLTAKGPGEYAGARSLFTAGAYSIGLEFKTDGQTLSRAFEYSLEGH